MLQRGEKEYKFGLLLVYSGLFKSERSHLNIHFGIRKRNLNLISPHIKLA